jgi:kumamolisin
MGILAKGALVAAIAAIVPAAAGAQPLAQAARVGPAPAAAPLDLVLPLRADLAGLRRAALAVTTPGSPQYREYQPVAKLAQRYGASPGTRSRVLAYLRNVGAGDARIDGSGLFASATMPAALAARLFATPLAQFRSAQGARYIAPDAATAAAASRAVPLPHALEGLATGVVGLDTQPLANGAIGAATTTRAGTLAHVAAVSSGQPRSGTPAGCAPGVASGGFTPNQIMTAYGYDPLHAAGVDGQGQRVALIEIDGFRYADVQQFAACFSLPIPAINTFGVGVSKLLGPGGEATLDLELLDAAAPQLSAIDVYETRPSAAQTLQALSAPLNAKQPPQVISASLGLCEQIVRTVLHPDGIRAAEGSLELAAASGTTFLASSGDQGSADCTLRDGTPDPRLAVNYPASSWWVTGVGGTNFVLNPANQIASQVVWNDGSDQPGSAGGGGQSILFDRPSYQRATRYRHARAVPDVSLLADVRPGYAIYCAATPECVNPDSPNPWIAIGGTSAATPLLAGGFALVNQQLQAAGRVPLGFVNPLLYEVESSPAGPSVFDDVTSGDNDVGLDLRGTPLGCCSAGVGYDDASGLGSINLAALAQQALAAQPPLVSASVSVPLGQRPIGRRQLLATVGCSGPCLAAAYVTVSVRGTRPFEVDSNVVRLASASSRTVKLRFSPAQVRRLSAALAAHRRITAKVKGVLLDSEVYETSRNPAFSIRGTTATTKLTLSS